MSTTLQTCYENILSRQIGEVFKFPGIRNKALSEVDGRLNIVVARRLDDLCDCKDFTILIKQVSYAAYMEKGGFAAGYNLIQYEEFAGVDLTTAQCDEINSFFSS